MAINCDEVAAEELKRLRDQQRLLQMLVIGIYGSLVKAESKTGIHLEQKL